jgi:hypothetical protein
MAIKRANQNCGEAYDTQQGLSRGIVVISCQWSQRDLRSKPGSFVNTIFCSRAWQAKPKAALGLVLPRRQRA